MKSDLKIQQRTTKNDNVTKIMEKSFKKLYNFSAKKNSNI